MDYISSQAILAAVYKAGEDTGVDIAEAEGNETAAETEEESTPSILKLDATVIWSIVNVLLLFILLRIFLFKPVKKIMEDRTAAIQKDIDEAKKSREEAEALRAECDAAVAQAKAEAEEIVTKAREDAAAEKQEILQQSKDEADRMIDAAAKNIESERQRSMQEAQAQIADLAIAAASKIVGENMDDSRNRKLVDDFLANREADES
ncbi:MAG: F0F1 ATP synthase subunit B [Ruminococcus sp.]|nr:F0F1 ATP synthase subunit B [Ruminococcus sp.]